MFESTSSCTSSDKVKAQSLTYLQIRYNENFVIDDIDMQKNEGNWGTTILRISPEQAKEIKVRKQKHLQ